MIREDRHDTSVQVAVRIRPLSDDELEVDNIHYITADPAHTQVLKQRSHLIMYMVLTRRSSQYMTNVLWIWSIPPLKDSMQLFSHMDRR
jgi:hypothetical protein